MVNDNEQQTDKPKQRTIRSFVRREGRITQRQQQALTSLWSRFAVDMPTGDLNFHQLFNREAPVVMEIGFGMGHSLLTLAQQNPQINYLGIEVHRPGVGLLLANLAEHNVNNVRVMMADANEILAEHIADNSLAAVLLFFPDPWPKKRHHKRRIVQPAFVEMVARKLQPGGLLHMATDWENYAEQMLNVATACQSLSNTSGVGQYAPRPESRPLTKFERRGQKLGHGVWDLLFLKVSDVP